MRYAASFLVAPALLVFLVFFILPFAALASLSFSTYVQGAVGWKEAIKPTLTISNYIDFFSSSVYWEYLFLTLRTAAVSTVAAVLLGYPVGYTIARSQSKALKKLLLVWVIAGLYVSSIGRVFSLAILLGRNGILSWLMSFYGGGPLNLIGTESAVDIGITYFLIPVAALSLVSAIQKIDPSLEDAARNLGATGLQTFYKVTLPLSLPGIIAATVLCLAIGANFFITPVVLGAGMVLTLPVLIYDRFMYTLNYPFGAVMSVILLLFALVIVYFVNKILVSRMAIR